MRSSFGCPLVPACFRVDPLEVSIFCLCAAQTRMSRRLAHFRAFGVHRKRRRVLPLLVFSLVFTSAGLVPVAAQHRISAVGRRSASARGGINRNLQELISSLASGCRHSLCAASSLSGRKSGRPWATEGGAKSLQSFFHNLYTIGHEAVKAFRAPDRAAKPPARSPWLYRRPPV
jgi:hypothetical protein